MYVCIWGGLMAWIRLYARNLEVAKLWCSVSDRVGALSS
jgi:hypothetical protein